MDIRLSEKAQKDIRALKKEDRKLVVKLWDLILDIMENGPNKGTGQPEELKHDLSGWWSRRISGKHRLYRVTDENVLEIISCYGHYGDR